MVVLLGLCFLSSFDLIWEVKWGLRLEDGRDAFQAGDRILSAEPQKTCRDQYSIMNWVSQSPSQSQMPYSQAAQESKELLQSNEINLSKRPKRGGGLVSAVPGPFRLPSGKAEGVCLVSAISLLTMGRCSWFTRVVRPHVQRSRAEKWFTTAPPRQAQHLCPHPRTHS